MWLILERDEGVAIDFDDEEVCDFVEEEVCGFGDEGVCGCDPGFPLPLLLSVLVLDLFDSALALGFINSHSFMLSLICSSSLSVNALTILY